jgi:hypothetical protein
VKKVTDKDVLALAQNADRKTDNKQESFSEFRQKFTDYLRSRGRMVEEPRVGLRPSNEAIGRRR